MGIVKAEHYLGDAQGAIGLAFFGCAGHNGNHLHVSGVKVHIFEGSISESILRKAQRFR